MADREEELDFWEERAEAIRRGELATVQAAAAGWSKLQGALLAVVSTAAFAGGITGVDDLADGPALAVRGVTSLAIALLLSSTVAAATASGNLFPQRLRSLEPMELRTREDEMADRAAGLLQIARVTGVIAVVLVVGGSGLVLWLAPAASEPSPPDVLGTVDGIVVCGQLARGEDGVLEVDGVPLGEPAGQLTPVAACP